MKIYIDAAGALHIDSKVFSKSIPMVFEDLGGGLFEIEYSNNKNAPLVGRRLASNCTNESDVAYADVAALYTAISSFFLNAHSGGASSVPADLIFTGVDEAACIVARDAFFVANPERLRDRVEVILQPDNDAFVYQFYQAYNNTWLDNVTVVGVKGEQGIQGPPVPIEPIAEGNTGAAQSGEVWAELQLKLDKIIGKNKLNPNHAKNKIGYLIGGVGDINADPQYCVTHPIEIKNGETLKGNYSSAGYGTALYTKEDVYIPNTVVFAPLITNNTGQTAYMRSTIYAAVIDGQIMMVELGSTSTLFEEYTDYAPVLAIDKELARLNAEKINVVAGKNKFDKNASGIILGKYLAPNGIMYSLESYYISDYIKLEESKQYTTANFGIGGASNCFYDENLNVIGSTQEVTFTTPANAAYIRMSGHMVSLDYAQLEEGSVTTFYEPYTEYAPVGKVAQQVHDNTISVVLPKKLYFAKNKEVSIYHENILFKNQNDPTSLFFNKGAGYSRQAVFNFQTATSSDTMTAQIIRSIKKGELKTLPYAVIDPAVVSGKTVNELHVGDSFTDIGAWVKECTTQQVAAGATINQIGTCGDGLTFKAEGLSGGTLANTFLNPSAGRARIVNVTGMTTMPTTGYPGPDYLDAVGNSWKIRGGKIDGSGNGKIVVTRFGAVDGDFATFPASGTLTKAAGSSGISGDQVINYTSPVAAYHNPFINHSTGLLDLPYYISFWGFTVPNIVAFQFTWNDLPVWAITAQIDAIVAQFKQAADHVHASYPSATVILSIEPYGAINNTSGLDWNGKKYSVLSFVKALITAFEDDAAYSGWVRLAPSYAFVDLIYGYAPLPVAPNSRYPSVTEHSGGDGVHPYTGMLEIGDCITPIMMHLIQQMGL